MKPRGTIMRTASLAALCLILAFVHAPPGTAHASDANHSYLAPQSASKPLASVLPPAEWRQLENSVDRALDWIAAQQADDGSFPSLPQGQPGVTSLCILAFISRGHHPGAGPHGDRINRALDYVLKCQLPDGLLSRVPPGPDYVNHEASHTAVYNHAIAGLMLGEVFGQVSGPRAREVKVSIEKALRFTRDMQTKKKEPSNQGGWRYVRPASGPESDLSITAWQLMFLRSAKNAEFDVPENHVREALAYVNRCWNPATGAFHYGIYSDSSGFGESRGMAGAGIVSLAMGAQHETPRAMAAGDWLVRHKFHRANELVGMYDKFYYSTYYCSQAAAQLGGDYWQQIFPPLARTLMDAQRPDGSWPPEPGGTIAKFGNTLTTALAVLSLTPPYELLPVYQR